MSFRRALVISAAATGAAQLDDMLAQCGITHVRTVQSAAQARQQLAAAEFDVYIINSPLRADAQDGEGADDLACELAERMGGEVLVLVREDKLRETSLRLSELGVFTVSKPLNRDEFLSVIRMASASSSRFRTVRRENEKLKQSLEDIKIINRAKLLLVSRLSMSEPEAHKYIEKQAMDLRLSRRDIADGILKTHEG